MFIQNLQACAPNNRSLQLSMCAINYYYYNNYNSKTLHASIDATCITDEYKNQINKLVKAWIVEASTVLFDQLFHNVIVAGK